MQRVKLPQDDNTWMIPYRTPLLKRRYSSDETSSGSGGGYMSPVDPKRIKKLSLTRITDKKILIQILVFKR
jgi:hypothetical protein